MMHSQPVASQDFTITLAPEREGVPPDVKLDGMYKFTALQQKFSRLNGCTPNSISWRKLEET